MKIQPSIKAAIGALLIGAASQASAIVLPLSPVNLTINATGVPSATERLTKDDHPGGIFNLSFLPDQFTINSLGISFTFADDGKNEVPTPTILSSSSSRSDFVIDHSSKDFTRTTTVTQTVALAGEQEGVKLSFGNISFDGATAAGPATPGSDSKTSDSVSAGKIWAKNSGELCTDHSKPSCTEHNAFDVTVTNSTTSTIDYTGNFEIAKSLMTYDSLLADLRNNKSLGFSFDVTGDLYLTGASLNINYTDTTPPPQAHNVPEPASLALFGIALMGVAGIGRARRG